MFIRLRNMTPLHVQRLIGLDTTVLCEFGDSSNPMCHAFRTVVSGSRSLFRHFIPGILSMICPICVS